MWRKLFGKYIDQIKQVFGRLTPSQRLTAVILGSTVFLGLLLLVFFTNRGSYTALARQKSPEKLNEMENQLKNEGYDVRVKDGVLEVKENELHKALNCLAGEISSTPRKDGWSWLDEDPKWGETSVRLNEKKRRSLTIILEESIKTCPDIADATLALNIKNSNFSVLDLGEKGNSASLVLDLAPGIGRLTSEQVRVIRNTISGGASIPVENISVTDNKLHEYPVEDGGFGSLSAIDEKRMAYIKHYTKIISDFISPPFRRNQFALLVDVKLSRDKIESENTTYHKPDPDDQLKVKETSEETSDTRTIGGAPGTGTNVKSGAAKLNSTTESPSITGTGGSRTLDTQKTSKTEVEYDSTFGHKLEKRLKPAGEIENISVSLRLDENTIKEIIAKHDEKIVKKVDQKKIDSYIANRKSEIENMLKVYQDKVNVSVTFDNIFFKPPEPKIENVWAELYKGAKKNISLIAVLMIVAGAMGFVYTLARKSIPPPIEIPMVEFPEEIEEDEKPEKDDKEVIVELSEEDKKFATHLEDIATVSQENPQVVAGVVRMWMKDNQDPGKEKK